MLKKKLEPWEIIHICKTQEDITTKISCEPVVFELNRESYLIKKDDLDAIVKKMAARIDDASDTTIFEKPLIARERSALLNIIGAILELLKTPREGRESNADVIKELIDNYPDKHGISKANLEKRFAEAKRQLEN